MTSRALAKARRQRTYYSLLQHKLYKVAVGGGVPQCVSCGTTSQPVLQLHHPDPGVKTRKFNQRTWSPKDLEDPAFVAELQGCMILCANCHAELHDAQQLSKLYGTV